MPDSGFLGAGFPSEGLGKRVQTRRTYLQARAAIYRLRSAGPTGAITFRCSRLRLASAQLPPATRQAPKLRRASLANQHHCLWPFACALANERARHGPPPPGGGGRRGGGRVRPPWIGCAGGLGGGPRGPEQEAGERQPEDPPASQMGVRSCLLTGGRDFNSLTRIFIVPPPHITLLRSWVLLMNGAALPPPKPPPPAPTPTPVLRIWSRIRGPETEG